MEVLNFRWLWWNRPKGNLWFYTSFHLFFVSEFSSLEFFEVFLVNWNYAQKKTGRSLHVSHVLCQWQVQGNTVLASVPVFDICRYLLLSHFQGQTAFHDVSRVSSRWSFPASVQLGLELVTDSRRRMQLYVVSMVYECLWTVDHSTCLRFHVSSCYDCYFWSTTIYEIWIEWLMHSLGLRLFFAALAILMLSRLMLLCSFFLLQGPLFHNGIDIIKH